MSEHYVQHGAEVVICGRRESVLADTAAEFKDKYDATVRFQPLDIRSPQDVEDFIDVIFQEGPLDGLVNSAAGNFISPTKDLSARGFDAIANIVFHGTFYVTNAVGKKWLEHNIKGSIISILATWVWTGSPFVVPSAMSKSALHTMTKSLAVEWGPHGIMINAIDKASPKASWVVVLDVGTIPSPDSVTSGINILILEDLYKVESLLDTIPIKGILFSNA